MIDELLKNISSLTEAWQTAIFSTLVPLALALAIWTFRSIYIYVMKSVRKRKQTGRIKKVSSSDKLGLDLENPVWEAFKDSFYKNRGAKLQLAKFLSKKIETNLKSLDSIYFGPGTTVYDVFNYIYSQGNINRGASNILTSNLAINQECLAKGLPIGLIGEKTVPEYPSLYVPDESLDELRVNPDVSIIGLAGIYVDGETVELKTCWLEQANTVEKIAVNTKKAIYLIGDCRKLTSTFGHVFSRLTKISESIEQSVELRLIISFDEECNSEALQSGISSLSLAIGNVKKYENIGILEWKVHSKQG